MKHLLSLVLLVIAACGDGAAIGGAAASGDAGKAPSGAGQSASAAAPSGAGRSSAAAEERCPDEIPIPGTACRVPRGELCQWKRSGPCPPDPDQLRQCIEGKWEASAPAVGCDVSLPCPASLPRVGTPCQTHEAELCQYKRGGPCASDPDQLRRCFEGKWQGLTSSMACEDAGADAGQ